MVYRNKILYKTYGKQLRESSIIKIIQDNPNIHFNAIKKILVPSEMALETLNRELKDLIQRKIIEITKMGDNKTHYILANSALPAEDIIKKIVNDKTITMNKNISELKQIYSKLTLDQKSLLTITYINSIFYQLNSIILYAVINGSEPKGFQKLESVSKNQINEIFKIIISDQDKSPVLLFLLDKILRISEFKNIIKDFNKIQQK